ncbi:MULTISPECIES: hypothetical protein [Enterobacteriaceae]|uniref:hypothetical protein n=1 Tax=Enterobacteriaceae TaxID=543 RepID=UPI001CF9DEBB|nr:MULTISPECIES: hypothetical protein [Enterobacteriaceae]MDC6517691.1 hypothetical protein [Klebsiella pneumoniae]MDC6565923.1 hypothetical protein [Klebsiella pneumoniae]MDC6587102.1 hypothetical protein [Klebsiella pneumoniae]MDC6597479.1 hypothetical protein [Klebsiella pneumoniae]MDC6603342.1 hypothetical protein [Klebsiella pneumoniae]
MGEISVKTGNNARNGGKNSLNRLIRLFAGKKSAQIREILISESAWEEMTCLFAPSFRDAGISHLMEKMKDGIEICYFLNLPASCLYVAYKTWIDYRSDTITLP